MRAVWVLAVLTALAAGGAKAQCPASAGEALQGISSDLSVTNPAQSVWFTPWRMMLGRDVPYVVVQTHEGRISTLFYRLDGATSRFDPSAAVYTDRLPADLEEGFRSLYPGQADCEIPSCIASDLSYGLGMLRKVHLGPAWHDVADDWIGPAVADLKADREALDAVSKTAVFLSCEYETIDHG